MTAKINPDEMSTEEISAYIGDVSSRASRHIGDRSQADWFLRELARDQGFDGLPDVVTKEQMDRYVAGGEREPFRGLDSYGMRGRTGEDLAKQFRSGDLYVGTGLFGDGTYVAYGSNKHDAEGYMGTNEEGVMLRMTLKPKSRVISVDELANMRINDPIANAHPELENLGRYATFRGYDVIDVGASVGQPKYMVILNRTAVRVQDRSIAEVP